MFSGPPAGSFKIVDARQGRLTCLISIVDNTTLLPSFVWFGGPPNVGIPVKTNDYTTPTQETRIKEFKRSDLGGLMDGEIWYEHQEFFGGNFAIVEVWCQPEEE